MLSTLVLILGAVGVCAGAGILAGWNDQAEKQAAEAEA